MAMIDMYVDLKDYNKDAIQTAIQTARQRGLEGLVFAVKSKEDREKLSESIRPYKEKDIKFFLGQKLKSIADNFGYSLDEGDKITESPYPGKTKMDLLVLWHKFLPENGYYDLDTLLRDVRKTNGIVLGYVDEKNPNLWNTGHLDGVIISSQYNFLTKEMWEKFFKKPVYGGSGQVIPEEVGRFVTDFKEKEFKRKIKKSTKDHEILMLRNGKYIPFRNPSVTLTIDPRKAEGLEGFNLKPVKIVIAEEE